MKRLASLVAVVFTLTMVLSLAACGSDETTPDSTDTEDTTQSQTTEDTQGTETTEPAAGVDLAALRTQFATDYELTDVLDVETEGLNNLYGITADQVASSASFNAASGAAFPQEIVMIQAVDEAAAADIAGKLESRLSNIAEQAASYDPESLELAENCPVVTDGVYVGMFFSSHYDDMAAAFQSALA